MNCWYCGEPITEGLCKLTDGLCRRCEHCTIPETMVRLHVSRSTIEIMLRKGRLKRIRATGRVLIRRAQVEALLR
jgi:excisionase family DNA binding protein